MNALPSADGSSTLAVLFDGSRLSSRTDKVTEAPEATVRMPATRPTICCPSRTSAPRVIPSAVGSSTVMEIIGPAASRPTGRS